MRSVCVLDTNILIYAAAGRIDEPAKFAVAERLVGSERFGLSGQILAEFYTTATRRPAVPLSPAEVERWINLLCRYPVVAIDETIVQTAIVLSRSYRISYWEAAILAATERLGAPILYSEDLDHDQIYGSVRVINPFLSI